MRAGFLADDLDGTVVVAVVAVGVMQVAVDEVVDMVSVGDRFVTTGVGAALVCGGAVGWVGGADFERVLIDVVVVDVMEVAVVEVVDVARMLDCGVSAAFAVHVIVGFVFLAAHLGLLRC